MSRLFQAELQAAKQNEETKQLWEINVLKEVMKSNFVFNRKPLCYHTL